VHIRLAQTYADLERIVEVISADQPTTITAGQMSAWDADRTPGRIGGRWVAVEGGEIIGYGVAARAAQSAEGHFRIWVVVLPAHRCRGVGAALYRTALDFAASHGASRIASDVRDNSEQSRGFAERRGFVVDGHSYELGLDLATFDARPYLGLIDGLRSAGVAFGSLADLGDTDGARRRLHEVNRIVIADIPGSGGDWLSYEEFVNVICGADWFRADGQLVAMTGDRLIGLSALQLLPQRQEAYNLMTGVVREHRRRGIGLALKVLAGQYAHSHGARMLRTNNDSGNAPMLALNRRLGYQPLPGKYELRLDL